MKNVGILAAMTMSVLGPASDVVCFFNSIVFCLEGGDRGSQYPSITDRLYCRSLNKNELCEVKKNLGEVQKKFYEVLTSQVDMKALGCDESITRLSLDGKTLADVFARFFDLIFEALECTEVFYREFKEYVPMRVGFTDAPYYIVDINRPADLYESISSNDLPFWLR